MASLKQKIRQIIEENGHISVEKYMKLCLYDPTHGYYSCKQPIGLMGDFTTSPEISQLFGELVGLWLAQVWLAQGSKKPFALVELGPGKGTLMSDILRATSNVPNFLQSASIFLVETSTHLRRVQKNRLKDFEITWLESVELLPPIPLMIIGNEFLDALPTKQFCKVNGAWQERCVKLNKSGNFTFCYTPSSRDHELQLTHGDVPNRKIIEISDQATGIISKLSSKLLSNGGVAIFIDYGHFGAVGDTLQSVRNHKFSDPLRNLGKSDLTTLVNFKAISETAVSRGLRATKPLSQGAFLKGLGIDIRLNRLTKNLSEDKKYIHVSARNRLVDEDQMGELFKVFALALKDAPCLPVLEDF